jgi:uracil-DNA glycosylase
MQSSWDQWRTALKAIFESPQFVEIMRKVELEYAQPFCFPKQTDIFKAFEICPPHALKCVIIGQDPYHGKGEAHGLSFSVPAGVKTPPSLRNIFKELYQDTGETRLSTDLADWAEQGILLLNTHLTVRENQPLSHHYVGWEWFTDQVIHWVATHYPDVIFVLWGNEAKKKKSLISQETNPIIESSHPSPLGAHKGFTGSRPFSSINNILIQQGKTPINWA